MAKSSLHESKAVRKHRPVKKMGGLDLRKTKIEFFTYGKELNEASDGRDSTEYDKKKKKYITSFTTSEDQKDTLNVSN